MTHLFYFTTLLFLCNKLSCIVSPIEKTKETRRFLHLFKINKGREWSDYDEELKKFIKGKLYLFIVALWGFIGLFTSQWIIFLSLFVFNIILSLIQKTTRYSILYTIIGWCSAMIQFLVGIFIIINYYHLHIDVFGYLKSLI